MTARFVRCLTGERWVRVPSFGDYIVSDMGRIRHTRVNSPILKGSFDKDGYHRVCLNGCTLRTHIVVCEAFHGRRPMGFQCAHLDGNQRNNRADNLAWATPKENATHKAMQGRPNGGFGRGDEHPHAKLTAAQVDEIRNAAGSSRALSKQFCVSQSQIVRIKNGDRW